VGNHHKNKYQKNLRQTIKRRASRRVHFGVNAKNNDSRSSSRAVSSTVVGFQFNSKAQKHAGYTTSVRKAVSRACKKKWLVFVGFEAVWAKKARNFDLKRCCVSEIAL
jgi:hypothetical protein